MAISYIGNIINNNNSGGDDEPDGLKVCGVVEGVAPQ